jgi:tetratricopeptide (TPR) repeat protein
MGRDVLNAGRMLCGYLYSGGFELTTIDVYIKSKDWDTAIADYTREISSANANANANAKTEAEAYVNRGYVRCLKGKSDEDYEKAIEDFSMAIMLFSSSANNSIADCYVKRAYAYYLAGNYKQAEADCNKVITDPSKTPDPECSANELLGIIYLHDKNAKGAVVCFGVSLAQHPTRPRLLDKYREACRKM